MSLQVKRIDLSNATFLNGALYDALNDKIKSEDIIEIGYPMETPTTLDGHFNNLYGRGGIIADDGRIFIPDTENKRLNVFDLQGNFLTKILFADRPKRARIDYQANEIFVFGDTNLSGAGHTCVVLDLDTYAVKRNIIPSTSSPDKTLGQVQYLQDGCIGDDGYLYIYDYTTGCVQKYDKQGNWVELLYDSGKTNTHTHIEYVDGYIYCYILAPITIGGINKKIEISTKTETDVIDTSQSHYWGEQKGFGKEISQTFDFVLFEDKIIICPTGYYAHYEMWNLSDLSFVDELLIHIWGGKKGQHYGDYSRRNDTSAFPLGIQATYNSTLKKMLFTHQTYATLMNARLDQTALWQNQSLGGAGIINQIAIKQSDNGTKNWYIKKSTDTAWQSFEPNKYYSTPLLNLSATESFDLKVEMGNFFDPIKEQIEIEEISVLFTPEINLPIVENLQITNETLTVSLVWESNAPMNYHVQEAKATIAEWQTIATTTGTTFTITYTDPEQQQIPHYFRVLGVLNNGYTEPTNVVVAYPSQGGEENIYKYCNNQLLSILKNDSRLADVDQWLDYPPEKTTAKHKIVGWVTYRGEVFNQPVALGEREIWLSFEVGVLVKESNRNERFNSLTKPERKDYIFLIKEIIYEINNRSLNDYIYDIEIRDEVPYRHKDYHSIGIVNVIFKKRIRRL